MQSGEKHKLWRSLVIALVVFASLGGFLVSGPRQSKPSTVLPATQHSSSAIAALGELDVKPAASKAGYSRKQYSDGWAKTDACTMRDKIMARDMTDVSYRSPSDCTVESGTLDDPYTGKIIHFVRGPSTSSAVQIDHVVAVSNAWQTGAQELTKVQRGQLYNDPLELIAVDGPANEQKGDGDASAWLPSNAAYQCRYVARQIAVKRKYHLWTTITENTAMKRVLDACPGQLLPSTGN